MKSSLKLTVGLMFGILTFTTHGTQAQVVRSKEGSVKTINEYIIDTSRAVRQVSPNVKVVPLIKKKESTPLSEPTGFSFSATLEKYAGMLKVIPEALGNLDLYDAIDDWFGTRYRLGGENKKGIDCSAFVQKVYEQAFGVNLLRTAIQQFQKCVDPIKSTDDLKEGDLVFFKTVGNTISHVGIYLTNNYFVHASSSQGVTISSLNDGYWKKKYAGAGQVTDSNMVRELKKQIPKRVLVEQMPEKSNSSPKANNNQRF